MLQLKVTKILIVHTKQTYRKEIPLLCNLSKNEINLNSTGLGRKKKGRRGRWLEYHG